MTTVVIVVVCAVLALYTAIAVHLLRRECRRPLERDRIIADSYQGPDSLRLMQDLDAHLDAHFAKVAGLYERLGPPPALDPMAAGCERLRRAVSDEQQKEGH
ncbi:hypothetical protein ACIGCZ_00845 [Streptomyces nigra]|uniref:hypothetical protein n=1 Tax=Streptomyces nigra TaxID=1827580 RepID=UPI0037D46428